MMDMAAAPCNLLRVPQQRGKGDSHDDKESGKESAKVDYSTPCALHEVILVRCAPADPVGQWCDYVSRYDEEGEVVVEQRRGEDDEQEAYREDLVSAVSLWTASRSGALACAEGTLTKDSPMMVLMPAIMFSVVFCCW